MERTTTIPSFREGPHEERLSLEPTVGEVLNDHFHRLVRGAQTLAPTWDDSIAVARLLDEIRRSGREGRRIVTGPPN